MRVKLNTLILSWFCNLVIHLTSLFVLAGAMNVSAGTLKVLSSGFFPATIPVAFLQLIYVFSGLINFYFFPGLFLLLGIRKKGEISFTNLLNSILLSILLLIVNVNIVRVPEAALMRWSLLIITSIVTLLLFVFTYYLRVKYKKEFFLPACFKTSLKRFVIVFVILLALTAMFALPLLKHTNFVFNCQEEAILSLPTGAQTDLHEKVGMARSLKNGFFPFWHLEHAPRFGYLTYELIPTYIYFINSVVFGDSFFIFYIFFFCCLLLATVIIWELAQESSSETSDYSRGMIILIAMCGYFWLTVKYPYHIAISTHLWILLLLMQIFILSIRKFSLFYLVCILSFFTKEISLIFSWTLAIVFAKMFLDKVEAKGLYKGLGIVTALLLLFIFCFGVLTKNLNILGKILVWDYFQRYDYLDLFRGFLGGNSTPLKAEFNLKNYIDFFAWIVGASFFQVIFLFFPSKDKFTRLLSYLGIGYIFVVLISQFRLVHYALFPILLSAPVCYRKLRKVKISWILFMMFLVSFYMFSIKYLYNKWFFDDYAHRNKILFNNSFDFQRELEKIN